MGNYNKILLEPEISMFFGSETVEYNVQAIWAVCRLTNINKHDDVFDCSIHNFIFPFAYTSEILMQSLVFL
jgi:hypothetical protein